MVDDVQPVEYVGVPSLFQETEIYVQFGPPLLDCTLGIENALWIAKVCNVSNLLAIPFSRVLLEWQPEWLAKQDVRLGTVSSRIPQSHE
jgi:hypothetical protein